jgi:hypothetical protein
VQSRRYGPQGGYLTSSKKLCKLFLLLVPCIQMLGTSLLSFSKPGVKGTNAAGDWIVSR